MRTCSLLLSRLVLVAVAGSLGPISLSAAEPAPALASLTYSGDQSPLEALDREIAAAGKDSAKLAAVESSLLSLLRRSDTTFAARQAACQRLALVLGHSATPPSPAVTKALGTLLADERDSDLARLALEPVPGKWIDDLLLAALGKTSGRTRLGLIDSVARRQLETAVPALGKLLSAPDTATATAAAHALGVIGSQAADAALRGATKLPAGLVGQARFAATTRMSPSEALTVLRTLEGDRQLPEALRAAALRRALDSDPDGAPGRIAEVLGGSDWTLKQVVLEALAGSPAPERVSALISNLATWDAPTQAAALAALGRSAAAAAVPAALAATRHASAEVRTEAFTALAFLPGNREVVELLATTVAADSPDSRTARQSLARLNGPEVSPAILAGAERGAANLRVVLLEQLALRHMTEALPLLHRCRQDADAAVRAAAVTSLGELAPFSDQQALLDWTIAATDENEQSRALRALVNVTLRNRSVAERGRAIHTALLSASAETAVRLLPALTRLGGSDSADCAAALALRPDPKVAGEAVATLGRWTDTTALAALTTVAEKSALAASRDSARDSVLRSLERNRDPWTPATTTVVSRLLATTSDASVRQTLLGLLARANDSAALAIARKLQSDASVAADARYAAAAIEASRAGAPKLRASPAAGIANATDGKTSTRWSAPLLGEEWVEIDFRRSRPLRRITLDQTGRAAEFPEKYEVHVTNDPKSPGVPIVSGTGQRNRTVIDLPAGTQGRYVIIRNTAERKDTPWAICELYVD